MRVLGIDPGSQWTGFGIVEVLRTGELRCVDFGVVSLPPSASQEDRLHLLHTELMPLLKRQSPNIVVVEKIFLGRNADSAFKLGQVRGVCLLAARQAGAAVVEYAARAVKKGITGSGAASKEQVQMLLFASLGIRATSAVSMRLDASDALALAYYHARHLEVDARFVLERRRKELQT